MYKTEVSHKPVSGLVCVSRGQIAGNLIYNVSVKERIRASKEVGEILRINSSRQPDVLSVIPFLTFTLQIILSNV